MNSKTRDSLLRHIEKTLNIRLACTYNHVTNISLIEGRHPHTEFKLEIPDLVMVSLTRPTEFKALADMLLRRWLDVQPEIFVDTNTSRIGIRIPYHVQAIEEIKAFIPAGARTWNGDTKTWYVNMSYVDNVERIIKKHFPNVKVTTVEAALPAPVDGDEFGALLRPLPDVALKAVYRAIAITCHPDRAAANGLTNEQATAVMREANIAWTRIKKAKGWE